MALWLSKGEICSRFDSIGKPIGQFVGVVPHSLASECSGGGSVTAPAVAIGNHGVVGLQFNHPALLSRIRQHFEFPGIDLPHGPSIAEKYCQKSKRDESRACAHRHNSRVVS